MSKVTEFINEIGIYNLGDIKRNHDGYWFSKDTMRYFNSRISEELFFDPDKKLIYFVSSERMNLDNRRLYTIRSYDPKLKSVDTFGEFQEYDSLSKAKYVAKRIYNE